MELPQTISFLTACYLCFLFIRVILQSTQSYNANLYSYSLVIHIVFFLIQIPSFSDITIPQPILLAVACIAAVSFSIVIYYALESAKEKRIRFIIITGILSLSMAIILAMPTSSKSWQQLFMSIFLMLLFGLSFYSINARFNVRKLFETHSVQIGIVLPIGLYYIGFLLTTIRIHETVSTIGNLFVASSFYLLFHYIKGKGIQQLGPIVIRIVFNLLLAFILAFTYSLFFIWAGIKPGNWFIYAILGSILVIYTIDLVRVWFKKKFLSAVALKVYQSQEYCEELATQLTLRSNITTVAPWLTRKLQELPYIQDAAIYITPTKKARFLLQHSSREHVMEIIDSKTLPHLCNELLKQQQTLTLKYCKQQLDLLERDPEIDEPTSRNYRVYQHYKRLLQDWEAIAFDYLIPILTEDRLPGILLLSQQNEAPTAEELTTILQPLADRLAEVILRSEIQEKMLHDTKSRLLIKTVGQLTESIMEDIQNTQSSSTDTSIHTMDPLRTMTQRVKALTIPDMGELVENKINTLLEELLSQWKSRPFYSYVTIEKHLAPDLPDCICDKQLVLSSLSRLTSSLDRHIKEPFSMKISSFYVDPYSHMQQEKYSTHSAIEILKHPHIACKISYKTAITNIDQAERLTTNIFPLSDDNPGYLAACAFNVIVSNNGYLEFFTIPSGGLGFIVHLPCVLHKSPRRSS